MERTVTVSSVIALSTGGHVRFNPFIALLLTEGEKTLLIAPQLEPATAVAVVLATIPVRTVLAS
jgi:hypothetical protein|tara:strand:- start:16635 stop:16826 length:192 start_codon:yes stop_codon:yes gene_type:complete